MNYDQWRFYLRGYVMEMFKRPQAALEAYDACARVAPAFFEARRSIALIHARAERWAAAAEHLRLALDLAPDDADTWFNLGFVQDKLGHAQEAIDAFRKAVERKPGLDRAWYGMGMAAARLGRHADAAAALEEAARLQPMNSHAWYALGMAHHMSHNPDRVQEVALQLHRFDPIMCRKLIQDSERADLAHLVKDLVV